MTSRDYRLIARVLRHAAERGEDITQVAHHFCLALKIENERFKRDRFLKACGIPIEEVSSVR